MTKNGPLDAENLKRVKRAGKWMAILGLTMIVCAAWLLWGAPGLMITLGVPLAALGVASMHVAIEAEKEKAFADNLKKKFGLG